MSCPTFWKTRKDWLMRYCDSTRTSRVAPGPFSPGPSDTLARNQGRRTMGFFRTYMGGRGGAATTRRLRPLVFPLIAMRMSLSALHEAGHQDGKLVEDYQGHHHGRHGEPVLARRDDRGED